MSYRALPRSLCCYARSRGELALGRCSLRRTPLQFDGRVKCAWVNVAWAGRLSWDRPSTPNPGRAGYARRWRDANFGYHCPRYFVFASFRDYELFGSSTAVYWTLVVRYSSDIQAVFKRYSSGTPSVFHVSPADGHACDVSVHGISWGCGPKPAREGEGGFRSECVVSRSLCLLRWF